MNPLVLMLLGCGDVTPGEFVLGDEVAAHVLKGTAGFGRSVALSGDHVLAAETLQYGEWRNGELEALPMGESRRVGHNGSYFWAWMKDGEVVGLPQGDVLGVAADASAVDVCPDGDIVSVFGPGDAVSCGVHGILRSECEDGVCSVQIDDGAVLDTVSPGGDLSWHGDIACWGDPNLFDEQGTGRVGCSDGTEVVGLVGDHLGLTIAGGMAAGRFNRHIVPPRLRIVSLVGGKTWLIDSAAENSRVSMDAGLGSVAVGVAEFRRGSRSGRIFVVKE